MRVVLARQGDVLFRGVLCKDDSGKGGSSKGDEVKRSKGAWAARARGVHRLEDGPRDLWHGVSGRLSRLRIGGAGSPPPPVDPAPVRPIQRQSQRPIQRLFRCPLPAREYSVALEAPGPMELMPGLLVQ